MFVIALIGMIAALLLVSLNSSGMKGRDARRISDLRELRNALQLYYDTYTAYPATLAAVAPQFISVIPKDPVLGASYLYDQNPGGNSYHLGANLEFPDNDALKSDADSDTATVHGSDKGNCAGVQNVGRYCYDIQP